jgi:hypothetical protein
MKAIYTFFLASGAYVAGVSGGYIAERLGYKALFWISTGLSAAIFIATLLLLPETLFNRKQALEAESTSTVVAVAPKEDHQGCAAELEQVQPQQRLSFRRSLTMFNNNRGGLWQQFVAPFLTLRFPAVWVIMLQYGALVGGLVSMTTVSPIFLFVSPYSWGENVGLVNLAGVVGTCLGLLTTYVVSDYLVKMRASREDSGLFEPEYRLPAFFGSLFLSTAGLWIFGFCAAHPSPSGWIGLAMGMGMLSFGIVQIPSIGFNYVSLYLSHGRHYWTAAVPQGFEADKLLSIAD